MNTTCIRQALLTSSVSQLEDLIDWLQRPWAPGKNDALRAAWHEARRSDGARRALAYAIEEEIRSVVTTERDAAHVARRLGLVATTGDAVILEIGRRLGALAVWPLPASSSESADVIASALRATAEIARLVLGSAAHERHGRTHHRRHRHGR
ncbi:MAG: hypothetical protein JWM74_3805 [Myxococcaceae bacterium]|nr:hypothetical protein [Myxococcaceae bacterium]